jgi:hypothetical protein
VVHLAKDKFARQFAGAQKVIRQSPQAVGFFHVFTKNAVTHIQVLNGEDVAGECQLIQFQSFDDHVRLPKGVPWQNRHDASVLEPDLAYFSARTLKV